MTDHKLLKVQEVADILRIPKPTVYYLAQTGKLPAIRIGSRWRFRREDINRLLATNYMPTSKP